jgi:hypothetical protein
LRSDAREPHGEGPCTPTISSAISSRSEDEDMTSTLCVVDDRVFLLGLDSMYRDRMQEHERGELLACARSVASTLHVAPASVPIEGYYAEDQWLREYFRLMRVLQSVPEERAAEVAGPELQRLRQVVTAPLYGSRVNDGHLLPMGCDPLTEALGKNPWSVPALTAAAHDIAVALDDFSLVGLAARLKDVVVLAACRESVVVYAWFGMLSDVSRPQRVFEWRVDDELARQAARFVDVFNELFDEELPAPVADNAVHYWNACSTSDIVGRCARLGVDFDGNHYHWAICKDDDGRAAVHEFWSAQLWTTERYKAAMGRDGRPPHIDHASA